MALDSMFGCRFHILRVIGEAKGISHRPYIFRGMLQAHPWYASNCPRFRADESVSTCLNLDRPDHAHLAIVQSRQ